VGSNHPSRVRGPNAGRGWGPCHCVAAQQRSRGLVNVRPESLRRREVAAFSPTYLATNKKKDVSKKSDLPWLPGPPVCWQSTHTAYTALESAAESAVVHQAPGPSVQVPPEHPTIPVCRVSGCTHRLQPLIACTFCPKSTIYLPTVTLLVFATLQPKQLATLPFELMAAVKNTTPLVGCAEPGVMSNRLTPARILYSSTFCVFCAVAGRANDRNSSADTQ
jgi:hypothetical protein